MARYLSAPGPSAKGVRPLTQPAAAPSVTTWTGNQYVATREGQLPGSGMQATGNPQAQTQASQQGEGPAGEEDEMSAFLEKEAEVWQKTSKEMERLVGKTAFEILR